jgi:hypothetical protein
MKKLIFFVCLAAVLIFNTQVISAQTSVTNDSTQGRFFTDVDLYMSVNDWADVEMAPWFSYFKMEQLNMGAAFNGADWETGGALKFENAYLGFSYRGKFNDGIQREGQSTITDGVQTGPLLSALNWGTGVWNFPGIGVAGSITRRNEFNFLLGLGNHGFKISLEDYLTTVDIPFWSANADYNAGGTIIPADSTGYYRGRTGNIRPTFIWGAATDMTFGRFTTRPSAGFSLGINFNERELGVFDSDIHIEDFSNNSLVPTICADTGPIQLWSGDWGTVSFGLLEMFSIRITGEGNRSAVPWENRLMPYVGFKYDASQHFRLGMQLSVPIWVGWGGSETMDNNANGTFFGIGARGTGATETSTAVTFDFPAFTAGFQLDGAFFDKLADKFGIIDKMVFNFGIRAYLPAYIYYGKYTYANEGRNITARNTRQWQSGLGANRMVQDLRAGIAFNITDNVVLDAAVNLNSGGLLDYNIFSDSLLTGSILLSVKHIGSPIVRPERPARAEAVETAEEETETTE